MQIIEWGKPLETREYPDPEPKGEEVLLRVEAAGVCHSDVHIGDGYFDLGGERRISLESRGVHLPFTMGHEVADEVAALGPHASGVKVVAYPWIGCGECGVCRKGEELLCLNPRTLGTRRAGGYGTHVIVPNGRYLLPHEGVPQGLAAIYTCSGITAFSALKKTRGHLGADDHLVIIGAGGVGGSAVHIAPASVAGKVIVADIDAQKRAHARQMGAVATIDNAAPDAVKQVMEATDGGAAAAIDFVGSPTTMEFGVNILRKGGKLVMVGLYGGACPISTVLFPFKMMTIEGSYVGTLEDLKELLALVQAGKVPPIPIETRPAEQASAALSDLKSGGKVRGAGGASARIGLPLYTQNWLQKSEMLLTSAEDEILTVIRLGLPGELRRSLACTNIIENMMGTIRRVCRNVKRWQDASMALRWTTAAMLEAAKGFRRLKAYKQLSALRMALAAHQAKHAAKSAVELTAKAA